VLETVLQKTGVKSYLKGPTPTMAKSSVIGTYNYKKISSIPVYIQKSKVAVALYALCV